MKIINKRIAKSKSSAAWLTRQLRDPFVERAKKEGYRARAAYKLIGMNERFRFLKNGQVVVDLGAAPGSWSQHIAKEFPKSKVIAMDLLPIKPIPGVEFYQGDFTTDEALCWLRRQILDFGVDSLDNNKSQLSTLNSKLCTTSAAHAVDVVLSDMAPNTTGHQKTDHLRQAALLEYAWDFARRTLKPGGTFVAKSFTGGTTNEILADIKKHFNKVAHVKPDASRQDSVEMFIVALGFRG